MRELSQAWPVTQTPNHLKCSKKLLLVMGSWRFPFAKALSSLKPLVATRKYGHFVHALNNCHVAPAIAYRERGSGVI